ncbi:MAG: ABC transporter permease subunit [Hyphomicrobiales bacterium]|nr:ABC transporter permease subunit [Hyphomicrobiales bacterium]
MVIVALLALWYGAAVLLNAPFARSMAADPAALGLSELIDATLSQERPVLPAPHQVLWELKKSVFDLPVTSKRSLVLHGWVTLSSTLVGFGLGALLGLLLAIGIVHVKSLEKSLMFWIVSSQTVPILAVAPIVIVVLGAIGVTGLVPKAIISAYLCFFPVTIGMVKGLTSPDRLHVDLMRTWDATPAQTFWRLRAPASVPFLFTSLEVAIAASLVGAIVGELPTGAQAGLGARLLAGSYYGQTIQIWAALFAAAALAASMVGLVGLIERLVLAAMGGRR